MSVVDIKRLVQSYSWVPDLEALMLLQKFDEFDGQIV